jgi:hypothetical protein
MAIDKSRTSPFVKGVIIFVAFTFAATIVAGGLSALTNGGGTTATTPVASTSTTATIDAIGLTHTPVIKATEASLTADPKNYSLLIQQAQNYYDWAVAVQQVTKGQGGQDTPIWQAAVPYYRRAVAVKKADPSVLTDYAVSMFYSRDATAAITLGKQVESSTPTFTPIVFNLGIFYLDIGDKVNAKAQLTQYLKLDPNGSSAAAAKDLLSKL